MRYSWFTVAMPESSHKDAVALLKKYGYDGIEWRLVADSGDLSKPSFWNGNRTSLQEDWSDRQFLDIAQMTRTEGLEMPNLGSYARACDFEKARRMIEIAALMKIPCLRVGVLPYDGSKNYNDIFKADVENFNRVVECSKAFKVKPLIEIHMGTIVASASAAIRFVSHWSPSEIGVIHDAGNMVYEGFENYQAGVEMLSSYLVHVHLKSSAPCYATSAGPQFMSWKTAASPLRSGAVDFTSLLKALKKSGYDGWLSFEDFSTVQSQEEKVADAISLMRQIEKSITIS